MSNKAQARRVEHAGVGDLVEPGSLPANILREGGGWVKVETPEDRFRSFRAVYVCKGAHKDGSWGWMATEVKR